MGGFSFGCPKDCPLSRGPTNLTPGVIPMSRGFDGFDIDDFRDPQCESERYRPGGASSQGRGSGSQSGAAVRSKLERLREAESIGDQVAAQSREHPMAGRSPLPRETKQAALLAERDRSNYREPDRGYSLRQSDIHTLTEVAKFRVVAVEDLAKLAYSGDRSRMENDLRSLLHQGLVERRETSVLKKESRQILTLTKQGQRLIRRQRFVPEDQAIYSGLVKPKESGHDADLYRLYHKVADRIEDRGGKIVRVRLDYELKEELYRKLGRAQAQEKNEAFHLKHAFAQQLHPSCGRWQSQLAGSAYPKDAKQRASDPDELGPAPSPRRPSNRLHVSGTGRPGFLHQQGNSAKPEKSLQPGACACLRRIRPAAYFVAFLSTCQRNLDRGSR